MASFITVILWHSFQTSMSQYWRDLRIVKELSWLTVRDTHVEGRSYKSLQQCFAFPVYLISLSMSVEVLDISIIGLAIGGLVHMVSRLSLRTQPYHSLCEVEQGWCGFDCQLYVTTHSHCLTLSDGFWWIWLPQSSLYSYNIWIKLIDSHATFKKEIHESLINQYPDSVNCKYRLCPDCYPRH